MAGSGTAAWLPKRPEQQPASASGPRFAHASPQRDRTARSTRSTRPFRFGSEDRPDPDPPLDPGALVGERYRIVSLLGEGGMGRVYAAEHTVLQRKVALKLLRRAAQEQPENLARFQQEALAASRIGTPQIVEVVDFASHQSPIGLQTYMVMELLDGESLEDWLEHNGGLDVGVELLAQLCDGLAAAHRVGVIHRDIKPANVFCLAPDPTALAGQAGRDSAPRVKILDFGIAKIAGGQGVKTQQGSLLGTPYYLAPERVMGASLTAAADVYSVGVILYEMLTGNVPFVADSFMGILARHVHGEPLDPRQAAPDRAIPDEIANLCLSLLAKQPEARPSATALAESLRALLARERATLAAVRVGPRELTAGTNQDTQVLADASASTPIADRPTLPPMDGFASHAGQPHARGSSPRSSTLIGHGTSVVVHASAPAMASPESHVARRPALIAAIAAIALVSVGALGLGGFALTRQLRTEPAPSEASPTAVADPGSPTASEPIAAAPAEPAAPPPHVDDGTPEPSAAPPQDDIAAAPNQPAPSQPAPNQLVQPEPSAPTPKPASTSRPKQDPTPKPRAEPEAPPTPEPEPAPTTPDPTNVDPQLPTIKDDVYD